VAVQYLILYAINNKYGAYVYTFTCTVVYFSNAALYTIQGMTINEGNFRGLFLKYNSENDLQCLLSTNTSQNSWVPVGCSNHLHPE
jgi:hypothetical protein